MKLSNEAKDFLFELIGAAVDAIEIEEDGILYLNSNKMNIVVMSDKDIREELEKFSDSLCY